MSYTSQKVVWDKCLDEPIVDAYGDIAHSSDSTVRCGLSSICDKIVVGAPAPMISIVARKQPKTLVFKTTDGRELLARSIYYVDPYVEKNAMLIKRMDKLDGELVEDVYVMMDFSNKPRMVRFITT